MAPPFAAFGSLRCGLLSRGVASAGSAAPAGRTRYGGGCVVVRGGVIGADGDNAQMGWQVETGTGAGYAPQAGYTPRSWADYLKTLPQNAPTDPPIDPGAGVTTDAPTDPGINDDAYDRLAARRGGVSNGRM